MTGAGDLFYRFTAQKRTDEVDNYGTTVGAFVEQFSVSGAIKHLRGSEEVLASRLGGVHPLLITVRATSLTRKITTDWRLIDARTGTEYAIRDVTPETDRAFISLLCESGVAT